jgi:hypothetical protein
MSRLELRVRGSKGDLYRLTFERIGVLVRAHCDCAAGANGQFCGHRINVLLGVSDAVVVGHEHVPTIAEWLPGSNIEDALLAVDQAERKLETAKKALAAAKKRLGAAMRL